MVSALGFRGRNLRVYFGEGVEENQEGKIKGHKRKQKHVNHNKECFVAHYVSNEAIYMRLGQEKSGNLPWGHSVFSCPGVLSFSTADGWRKP